METGEAVDRTWRQSSNGPEAMKRPEPGRTGCGGGAERPNGLQNFQDWTRRSRPGTLTLEWSPGSGELLQESERPLRATGPDRKNVAARWNALILKLTKAALEERTGGAPGTFDCSAQYRACRW